MIPGIETGMTYSEGRVELDNRAISLPNAIVEIPSMSIEEVSKVA